MLDYLYRNYLNDHMTPPPPMDDNLYGTGTRDASASRVFGVFSCLFFSYSTNCLLDITQIKYHISESPPLSVSTRKHDVGCFLYIRFLVSFLFSSRL